jgi:hypothetical protein
MFTTEAGQPPEPFTIDVDQSVLGDLVARLKDDRYGLSTSYLVRLVAAYWADVFDWPAIDGNINSFYWTCTPSAVMRSSRGGFGGGVGDRRSVWPDAVPAADVGFTLITAAPIVTRTNVSAFKR